RPPCCDASSGGRHNVIDSDIKDLLRFLVFLNDTATTEIYTLSLHDALPICQERDPVELAVFFSELEKAGAPIDGQRSEEHTSELQSIAYLVWRLTLDTN